MQKESSIYLPVLWVAQQILMLLPSNPPWERVLDRERRQALDWNDKEKLRLETTKNTQLLLSHSRLILGLQSPRRSVKPPTHRQSARQSVTSYFQRQDIKQTPGKHIADPQKSKMTLGQLLWQPVSRLKLSRRATAESGR